MPANLPELPEPYALECGARFNEDGTVLMEIFAEPLGAWLPCEKKQPLYTSAQLCAYGEACRGEDGRDAARYRALKANAGPLAMMILHYSVKPENWDAAIDAAMTTDAEKGK